MKEKGEAMKETVNFPINTPVEVTLLFGTGKRVEGRYGEQVMYSLLDNRVMYVPPFVEQRFQELSGVNYFFRLTTIISPEQRQLLSGAGDSPPLFAFLVS